MAKFIKSMFAPSERKTREAHDDSHDYVPPMDSKRHLSISRSGRLKQSNKKRNSLSVIVQNDDEFQSVEKPNKIEYHVNTPAIPVSKETTKTENTTNIREDSINKTKKSINNTKKSITKNEEITSGKEKKVNEGDDKVSEKIDKVSEEQDKVIGEEENLSGKEGKILKDKISEVVKVKTPEEEIDMAFDIIDKT